MARKRHTPEQVVTSANAPVVSALISETATTVLSIASMNIFSSSRATET